ncbi:4-hydroxy-tetrahydrodipicolinate reductase [Parvibaculum indicum]|uniref:4-hydroxy-tetrahydrodipicolinate reductase n=1 Tax=Parvibaculum indicum TaxID=562969 RepID=UPI00141FF94A|nr:4-hydroxy-tetrahydrodipicolinate reductase [Parvibaculum indicum]NIJ42233.1 4-hydroxy-tetrahydrodipicolinate reductase [Parvibaculum indicum]
MTQDLKIAVTGAAGRMGRTILKIVHETPGVAIGGGIEAEGSPHLRVDLGELAGLAHKLGLEATSDAGAVISACDAIIDFTRPAASVAFAQEAAKAGKVHVIATTGFTDEDEAAIAEAAKSAIIVKAGNMSLGVNLLAALVRQAARALDASWDVEIVEMHHRHKVDAPSGTALMLGEAAAEGRDIPLKDNFESGRDGITGERKEGAIGFAALRGGSVVGEHQAIFAGAHERLVLGHIAEDRGIFARGAVKAALWAQGRKPGLYDMADVLGIN